jgi:hypothetical protein
MLVFHRSLGITIFVVVVLRLTWRSTHPAPPLPSDTPRAIELISQVTHWLLYALLLSCRLPVTYSRPMVGRCRILGCSTFHSCRRTRRWGMLPMFFIWLDSGVYIRWSASTWGQPSGTLLYDATDCSIACFRHRTRYGGRIESTFARFNAGHCSPRERRRYHRMVRQGFYEGAVYREVEVKQVCEPDALGLRGDSEGLAITVEAKGAISLHQFQTRLGVEIATPRPARRCFDRRRLEHLIQSTQPARLRQPLGLPPRVFSPPQRPYLRPA